MLVVGAHENDDNGNSSGSAYVFDLSTGQQLFKLLPDDGAANDHFGLAVAIEGNIIAVSAHLHAEQGVRSGAVYIFDATTGLQAAELLSDDRQADDRFGSRLAIDNEKLVVSAPGQDANGDSSGAAYLFDLQTNQQVFKPLQFEGAPNDLFGTSVDINGNLIVIGSIFDNTSAGVNTGSVSLFDATSGAPLTKLQPADGHTLQNFGTWVALDNNQIVVGAPRDGETANEAGAGYIYNGPFPCNVYDLAEPFSELNFFDIVAFINGRPDLNGDDLFNFFDVSIYISGFQVGCPSP